MTTGGKGNRFTLGISSQRNAETLDNLQWKLNNYPIANIQEPSPPSTGLIEKGAENRNTERVLKASIYDGNIIVNAYDLKEMIEEKYACKLCVKKIHKINKEVLQVF